MPKETILVDKQPYEIETAPITLVTHAGGLRVDALARVEIGSPATLMRAAAIHDDEWQRLLADPIFLKLFHLVYQEYELPDTVEELLEREHGVQHVVGMLLMIVDTIAEGKQIFLRTPEAHLHPRQQSGLGDLLAYLTVGLSAEQKEARERAARIDINELLEED
jgi:hypothetical protein